MKGPSRQKKLSRVLPIAGWLPRYQRADLAGDLLAGGIVALMLVPQAMAYALLAGLPPEVGLYASVLPLALYALFGSSRTLAVGPVAMVSLLVADGVAGLAAAGSAEAVSYALTLAAMVGVLQLGMGVLRLGFLTNLMSHPVLSGFTSAAALLIATSQLQHVLGVKVPRSGHFHVRLAGVIEALPEVSAPTLAIGAGAIALLVVWPRLARAAARAGGEGSNWVEALPKAGPLVVVFAGTVLVALAGVSVAVVGEIPRGLPRATWPVFGPERLGALLPTALVISLVGFMESIAIARSLAARRRQRVDADQELVALGVANLGAALTGGYPVTGGFSRSVVNFDAGARTGVASLVTAGLVLLTLAFLTPLLHDLPKAVLGAIVIVAVAKLVDLRAFVHAWRYSRRDGLALLVTFVAVLELGIEAGLVLGALTALVLHLSRTWRPHLAVVGRVPGTEHFRNVRRHQVETDPRVLLVRIDESLFFLNVAGLEERVLQLVHERSQVRDLVLICSAVNSIDASALETLEDLARTLDEAGVRLHLAEVKGPVTDRLERAGFLEQLGRDRLHLSPHAALASIARMVSQNE